MLRAAIGYTLSEETIALARLRERYAPKFADGPDARAFAVVSAPIGAGNGEFQDVARRIAAINTLDAFLRDVHERYPDAPAAGDVNAEKRARGAACAGRQSGGRRAAQGAERAAGARQAGRAADGVDPTPLTRAAASRGRSNRRVWSPRRNKPLGRRRWKLICRRS